MTRSPRLVLSIAVALGVGWLAGPAPAADMVKVSEAVRKATEYLKKTHAPAKDYSGGGNGGGAAPLAGLAMLEGGAAATDPAVQNVAEYVRRTAVGEGRTYQAALALVFLDRLGDRRDAALVQVLGVRLYSGMNAGGGWTYTTWPSIPAADVDRLRAILYTTSPPPPGQLHPEAVRQLRLVRAGIAAGGRQGLGQGEDHSNTQFALVGLWVAARHGLPVGDALAAVEARFLRLQNRTDGGWAYTATEEKSTAAMTCAGLLGLAAGAARRESALTGKPLVPVPAAEPAPEPTKKEKEGPNDPFLNPRKPRPESATAEPPPEEEPPPEPAGVSPAVRTIAVQAALVSLGRVLAASQSTGGVTAQGGGPIGNFIGHGNWYYTIWSVERVGVALGLDTIGGVNWYDWGAAHLLSCQNADGSWGRDEAYSPDVNTSFAVLFLCKTNLVADLSGKMKGKVKDPGRAELRGGGAPPLYAPARPEPERPAPPVVAAPEPDVITLPQVVDAAESVRVSTRLTEAKDDEWNGKLAEARDAKGVMNTLGLAHAIGRLTGVRRKDARDALADRLTRMTAATLRGMLRDPDPEVRRAAALAAGMKEDKAHVPDLIDRLTDPSDMVVRAARAGLKNVTGKDFGPETGADAQARLAAAAEWQKWYGGHGR